MSQSAVRYLRLQGRQTMLAQKGCWGTQGSSQARGSVYTCLWAVSL